MANSLTLALYLATRARAGRSGPRGRRGSPAENERDGVCTQSRHPGPLVWFHTGADRHGLAARELAQRMRLERDDISFLFTTSADRRRDTEPGAVSLFAPNETLPAVRRFLDHWRPDVAIWTSLDLRPALIAEASDRGVALYLIDAHTARPEPHTFRWMRGMTGALLGRFRRFLVGDANGATLLQRLGAEPGRIEISGFLEEGTPPPPCNEAERDALAARLAARPVWLAAMVSDGELDSVLDAHARALRRSHRLLLILVPGDPEAGTDWVERATARGLRTVLRSAGGEPEAETQIYVADTDGELGLWLRLAPIAFLGRSLVPEGGINPYAAAALGAAIIHGPNVREFRQAYGRLGAAGATRLVRDAGDLGEIVEVLLAPDVAARMAHEAWKVSSAGAEVTDRVLDLILTEIESRELA